MAVVKTLIGNVKGPKGDTGAKGDTGEKGDIGATGQRGSRWTQGTTITGTSTTDTVFSDSGISDALVNDNYLNTSTGNTYRCTVGGDASTAMWVYSGNIKGVKGDTGAKGDKGDTGATGPQGEKGEKGDNGVNSFSDHDTATSGTSFTDAEDGNMLVTDWTKNLMNPTLETTTQNGVTCTRNVDANGKPDGTYTLNGTASANTSFEYNISNNANVSELGYCKFVAFGGNITSGWMTVGVTGNGLVEKSGENIYVEARSGSYKESITLISGTVTRMYSFIQSGTVLDNVLIKPMLTTDLNATYDNFVPYGGYEIQSCGKNLFDVNTMFPFGTSNGITVTNNGDGSYTLSGTATSNAQMAKYLSHKQTLEFFKNGAGTYTISIQELSAVTASVFQCTLIKYDGTNNYYSWFVNNSRKFSSYNITQNMLDNESFTIGFQYYISNGITINQTFYPQVEFGSEATEFELYQSETITVTNDTESPAFGLKSHKGITNIISPGNVKCVYPTNESGKGLLDAMYNNSQLSNELSKLKNAIIAMGGTV